MRAENAGAGRTPLRILVVDDHPPIREALRVQIGLEPDLEVCGEAADVVTALKLVQETRPDVAIIDITLEGGHGIDLIKRIKAHTDDVRMLVWSMHDDNLYAARALRAGAMGYINKKNATDRVIEAIRRVAEGRVYLSEEASSEILARAVGEGGGPPESPLDLLSDRELEVYESIGKGLSTQQIADRMHISPKTVETYRARVKEKLGVKDSRELTRVAMQWVMERE